MTGVRETLKEIVRLSTDVQQHGGRGAAWPFASRVQVLASQALAALSSAPAPEQEPEILPNGVNLTIVGQAYGWTFDNEGHVLALIAGDGGFEKCGIQFDEETREVLADYEQAEADLATLQAHEQLKQDVADGAAREVRLLDAAVLRHKLAAAEARVTALEQERDEFRAEMTARIEQMMDEHQAESIGLLERLEQAQAEITRFQQALKDYGRHTSKCDTVTQWPGGWGGEWPFRAPPPCTCGFGAFDRLLEGR